MELHIFITKRSFYTSSKIPTVGSGPVLGIGARQGYQIPSIDELQL
jgi:hypothetical protein